MSLDPALAAHAVAAAGDAIVTLDHSAKVTSWNRAAEQLLGFSPEDAMEPGTRPEPRPASRRGRIRGPGGRRRLTRGVRGLPPARQRYSRECSTGRLGCVHLQCGGSGSLPRFRTCLLPTPMRRCWSACASRGSTRWTTTSSDAWTPTRRIRSSSALTSPGWPKASRPETTACGSAIVSSAGADARLVRRAHRGRPGRDDGAAGQDSRRGSRRPGRGAAHRGGHRAQDDRAARGGRRSARRGDGRDRRSRRLRGADGARPRRARYRDRPGRRRGGSPARRRRGIRQQGRRRHRRAARRPPRRRRCRPRSVQRSRRHQARRRGHPAGRPRCLDHLRGQRRLVRQAADHRAQPFLQSESPDLTSRAGNGRADARGRHDHRAHRFHR